MIKIIMVPLIIFFSVQVNAATYAFSYKITPTDPLDPVEASISGMLEGTLQADGDTIAVSGIWDLALNPASFFGITLSEQVTGYTLDPAPIETDPLVSLSGSTMNIGASDSGIARNWAITTESFLYETGYYAVDCCTEGFVPLPRLFGEYDSSNWSIQPVPLPAAVWLFGSALMALGVIKWKRA